MPANLFLTKTWPSESFGTGWDVVYSRTSGPPVLETTTAFIVEGREDMLRRLVVKETTVVVVQVEFNWREVKQVWAVTLCSVRTSARAKQT